MPDEPVSRADFLRLEQKVDQLNIEYRLLIKLDERMAAQGARIGDLESRMKADEDVTKNLSDEVKSWINRGIGIWAVALTVWAVTSAPWIQQLFTRK